MGDDGGSGLGSVSGSGLTALVDHVEGGVGEIVVFEQVFGRAGQRAHEYRVVLRRDEGDGGKAQVQLCGHSTASESFTGSGGD